ncbi:hypothetical protein G3M48_009972, partial [Beauveria asiatica]
MHIELGGKDSHTFCNELRGYSARSRKLGHGSAGWTSNRHSQAHDKEGDQGGFDAVVEPFE